MVIECPTCDNFIIIPNGKYKPDHTFSAEAPCKVCGAIYAIEVRELRESTQEPEWIGARRNRTS